MRYFGNEMMEEAENLLECIHWDPSTENNVVQSIIGKICIICFTIWLCNLAHAPIEFTFKIVLIGEGDLISFKFDNEYCGGTDLR